MNKADMRKGMLLKGKSWSRRKNISSVGIERKSACA